MKTLYGDISKTVYNRLGNIKLLICDVDGVFSDGSIYLGNQGEEYKAFNTKDGFGVKALQRSGVCVAIVTGRNSKIVSDRMSALGIQHIIQGQEQKAMAVQQLMATLHVTPDQIAAIGDDLPDLGMFEHAAVGIAPQDAHPTVKNHADYVTVTAGGKGCVREVCDIILQFKQRLDDTQGTSA